MSCLDGFQCERESDRLATPCPAGSYCKNGRIRTCPSGHFCLQGTAHPLKCLPGAVCPKGSDHQVFFLLFLLSFILCLLVLVFIWAWSNRKLRRWLYNSLYMRIKWYGRGRGPSELEGSLGQASDIVVPVDEADLEENELPRPMSAPISARHSTIDIDTSEANENEEKEGVDLRVSSRSSFRSSVDEDCDLDENQGRLGKSASRSRLRSSVAIMERSMSDLGDLERSSSVELEIPSSEDLANSGLKSKDKKEVDDLRIPSTTSRKRKALSRSLGLTPPRVDGFLLKAVQEVVPRVQQAAGADFDSRISLKWENLRVSGRIYDVTGAAVSGRFLMIIGGSGEGKSTTMSCLKGDLRYDSGTVSLNGTPSQGFSPLSQHRNVVGFVPQTCEYSPTETVAEFVTHRGRLRSSKDVQESELKESVLMALKHMNLTSKAGSYLRSLSGGQLRRAVIAGELVSKPAIIFLDEPTSGLDSVCAYELCALLQRLAESKNVAVIAVVHSPSTKAFLCAHDLLVVAQGCSAYFGPTNVLPPTLAACGIPLGAGDNPCEQVLVNVSGELIGQKSRHFETMRDHHLRRCLELRALDKLPYARHEGAELPTRTLSPLPFILYYSLQREISRILRDPLGFVLWAGLNFIGGFLLGIVIWPNQYVGAMPDIEAQSCPPMIYPRCGLPIDDKLVNQNVLLTLSISLCAISMSVKTFGSDWRLFCHELLKGTAPTCYFIAKILANLPFVLATPLLFLGPLWMLAKLTGSLMAYYAVLLLQCLWATGMGYLLSIGFPDSNYFLIAVVACIVTGLVSGLSPNLVKVEDSFGSFGRFVWALSPNRWTVEALYRIEVSYYSKVYDVEKGLSAWGYSDHLSSGLVVLCCLWTLLIAIGCFGCAYLMFAYRCYGKDIFLHLRSFLLSFKRPAPYELIPGSEVEERNLEAEEEKQDSNRKDDEESEASVEIGTVRSSKKILRDLLLERRKTSVAFRCCCIKIRGRGYRQDADQDDNLGDSRLEYSFEDDDRDDIISSWTLDVDDEELFDDLQEDTGNEIRFSGDMPEPAMLPVADEDYAWNVAVGECTVNIGGFGSFDLHTKPAASSPDRGLQPLPPGRSALLRTTRNLRVDGGDYETDEDMTVEHDDI